MKSWCCRVGVSRINAVPYGQEELGTAEEVWTEAGCDVTPIITHCPIAHSESHSSSLHTGTCYLYTYMHTSTPSLT